MFVLQSAVVKGRGGIATAVAHYERMFRAVGVRSAVLFSGPSIDALREQGVDVIAASKLLTSPIAAALPLLPSLRREVLARAAGAPIVAIVHSDLTLPALQRLFPEARFVTPCHSDKFKHKKAADLVVTLNAAQHEAARAALTRPRIAQLGNPYVAAPPPPLREDGAPRLNFVARFIPTKDPQALLRAAALMSPPPPLRFFGDGELAGDLRAAAQSAGLAVEFAGWRSAPFADFHRNDILVLPSHWEGLPYLLQEALDHGVPTIASDIPGSRTALGDGAYGALFPLGDDALLARTAAEALANLDALRDRAEKGRAALRERYGAEAFWRALSAELQQVGERSHV
ncbi:MAG TPA: glycosyltransferase [Vitreimonas sp.]|uniref:glycosyltransferase n=1 Tax=Vitreimonas sp. TaxID=3069702 RepID=UPI002D646FA5|nr:glycosyltransferase [Vitreimonas sp.]HYD86066.1 glycosyltransferase [Vitreimonas sp.]